MGNELFPNRLIGRRENIEWLLRLPDLVPSDFLLWGQLEIADS